MILVLECSPKYTKPYHSFLFVLYYTITYSDVDPSWIFKQGDRKCRKKKHHLSTLGRPVPEEQVQIREMRAKSHALGIQVQMTSSRAVCYLILGVERSVPEVMHRW